MRLRSGNDYPRILDFYKLRTLNELLNTQEFINDLEMDTEFNPLLEYLSVFREFNNEDLFNLLSESHKTHLLRLINSQRYENLVSQYS